MDINKMNIAEVEAAPPALELNPEEIAELADELVDYHAEFAELYYRLEQAHRGHKYLQGLMLPIERKSIQLMALALEEAIPRRCSSLWVRVDGKIADYWPSTASW